MQKSYQLGFLGLAQLETDINFDTCCMCCKMLTLLCKIAISFGTLKINRQIHFTSVLFFPQIYNFNHGTMDNTQIQGHSVEYLTNNVQKCLSVEIMKNDERLRNCHRSGD